MYEQINGTLTDTEKKEDRSNSKTPNKERHQTLKFRTKR